MRFAMWCLLLAGTPVRLAAQRWLPADSVPLVGRAVVQRSMRDADSLLAGWKARAHGVVRFASVIDHGGYPIERVIKVDELQVEVYGESPNRSKQVITAWRDTTFLPNRIVYHRDHLGIVAHDFGSTIRIGEGDEVRDVVHPLSATGRGRYLFQPGDTVTIGGPAPVRVVAVAVRPIDPEAPGTVGTLYIDLDRAVLVRFRFTFTAASYLDATVDAITVSLENALQEGARWLPWRQAIVISRGTAWLDLPVRTVIRGDWTIDDYELGVRHPVQVFTGPLVGGLRRAAADSGWPAPIAALLDELPPTEADVAAARREAARAIGERLAGLPSTGLFAGGVSGLLRVSRVDGLTPAVAVRAGIGRGTRVLARIGYGVSSGRLAGGLQVTRRAGPLDLAVGAERIVRDLADEPIISGVLNSLRTAVAGDDRLDWVAVERIGAQAAFQGAGYHVDVHLAREASSTLQSEFRPISGHVQPNPPLGGGAYTIAGIAASRTRPDGSGWRLRGEAGAGGSSWARVTVRWTEQIEVAGGSLRVDARAGGGSAELPVHRSFVLGGRSTLPGVAHRAIGGRRMGWVEFAWSKAVHVPTPPMPQVRNVPLPSALGPFVALGVAGGDLATARWRATGRVEPVVGLRLDLWGPLARIETGMSLRTGRIAVTFDAHPDWWPVL